MMAASSTDDPLALAEQAEAEAAEAEAQAAAARARAAELRAGADDAAGDDTEGTADSPESPDPADPDRRRRPSARIALLAVAALVVCALLAASGLMLWQGHRAGQRQAHQAEFAAAARQGVVNLMSLDFSKGDADIKRLIDSTTGQFRDDFQKSQNDFLTVMKESKVVTTATIKATAVESMADDSAVVLVAAASEVSNAASAKQPPRTWRLAVTVQRDNGQLKMSKVEFVP